jgi:hypothetical protein
MNVYVSKGSSAERAYRRRTGVEVRPEERAPGIPGTPAHDLVFHGGKTIAQLTFTNFYLGGSQAWQPGIIPSIDQALAAAMADRRLNNVMAQYFPNQQLTSTFMASSVLPDSAPPVVSKTDVENLIGTLLGQGLLRSYDLGSTVINIMLPSGTVLNDQASPTSGGARLQEVRVSHKAGIPGHEEADSLHGLGGYHGSVHLTNLDGTAATVYYAVGVFSEQWADGTVNGIPVFDAPWKNVVATFYHELNEARTDADVEDAIDAGNDPSAEKVLGWTSRQGEECGDFPVFEANPLTQVFQEVLLADGSGTVPVQFMYSNAVHGPEGPIDTPRPAARTCDGHGANRGEA